MLCRPSLSSELKKIDADVWRVFVLVSTLILLVVIAYVAWFALVTKKGMSDSPEIWGAFGDYFGGLLNPTISLVAIYWIMKSFRLQKEELAETRMTLEISSTAQRQQVAVASYTALINSNTAQIQYLQYKLVPAAQRAQRLKSEGLLSHSIDEKRSKLTESNSLDEENKKIEQALNERIALGVQYEEHLKALARS